MPEADPKNGFVAQQAADVFDRVGQGGGVARAIREEDAIWVVLERFFGGRAGGYDGDAEARVDQAAQDVALGAVVER